ncbi:MAG TPA: branched-chain amino acid ABC transporter permease [Candidatus Limnocylindria bacterium]|jgi:branched-chain amino acid transport system permease protein|nr:branched-chain amino acid ABC transporter permease [Candidatus Limnocylindria bacterium]
MTEFLQQILNGLALGAIYALIALGYTMVYGVLRFINFAHSDIFMLGAFSGFYLEKLFARYFASAFPPQSITAAIIIMLLSMAICAALGVAIEYLAYRPLRKRPRLTVLITAIGVSLFIEYTCQHPAVFGPSPQAFPKLLPEQTLNLGGVVMSSNQVVIFVVTGILLVLLTFIVQRTKVGMAMRAVSFNERAAALMGVNVDRIVSFTFALGSALAAAGGILFAIKYQKIEPLMGVQMGLKAFVAAVLGGIGNLPGACLGGLVLGLVESAVGGVARLSTYRDGVAFAFLIAVLLFRPDGLLGKATKEKV